MPTRKHTQSVETILLELTAVERKMLLESHGLLDDRLVKKIRDTSSRQRVRLTQHDLDDLAGYYFATILILSKDGEPRQHLSRLYEKMVRIRAEHGMKPIIESARERLLHGIRLTQGERESLVHRTNLQLAIKRRLAEVPPGTRFLSLGRRQLAEIRRVVEEAIPPAVSPHTQRFQRVVEKIGEVTSKYAVN